MPKELTKDEIYIAPQIRGRLFEDNSALVYDEKNNEMLDPSSIDDKIKIYERQVNGWFLDNAESMLEQNSSGFVILMICLSYIEGVEQYRQGDNSRNNSTATFINGLMRLYPSINYEDAKALYYQARCGLFHDGMVRGQIQIKDEFPLPISFRQNKIQISPFKLYKDIKTDFQSYLDSIRQDGNLRDDFNKMYSNLPQNLRKQ